MKKSHSILAIVSASLMLAACGKVPAGNVGVRINLYGSDKGVDAEALGPGRYWVGWNQELHVFPTFTQNYVWTREPDETGTEDESLTFQTVEGMNVNADVGISYSIKPDMVPVIFQKYRRGVEEITSIYLRNMVRDAMVAEASRLRIESVYGAGKEELIRAVEDRVRQQVSPIGIVIERVYWVGTLRLPDNVVASINAKIEATQKTQQRQNEIEQTKAEAQKKIEEARGTAESIILEADAQAKANKLLTESLTTTLVRYMMIQKWDGILPKIMGAESNFMLNMNDDTLKNVDKPGIKDELK